MYRWGSGHRSRLEHHGLIFGARQGWMSQRGVEKFSGKRELAERLAIGMLRLYLIVF